MQQKTTFEKESNQNINSGFDNWYLVRVITGQDKKFRDELIKEAYKEGLEKELYQVIVPSYKQSVLKNGKRKNQEKLLFPGYVMIQANIHNDKLRDLILNISGSRGFLGVSKRELPPKMRPSEVERMLGVNNQTLKEDGWQVGESVKIVDGPFTGFTGHINKVNEEKSQLEVHVTIFGRETPVSLNFSQIEKNM